MRLAVNQVRNDFLAGPRFPLQQHSRFGVGYAQGALDDPSHGFAARHYAVDGSVGHRRCSFGDRVQQGRLCHIRCALFQYPAHQRAQFVRNREGLGEVVHCSAPECISGRCHGGVSGNHDDFATGTNALGSSQKLDAIHARHSQVGDYQIEILALE